MPNLTKNHDITCLTKLHNRNCQRKLNVNDLSLSRSSKYTQQLQRPQTMSPPTTTTTPSSNTRQHASSRGQYKPSSSAARRNALREFYKLSTNKPATIGEHQQTGPSGSGSGSGNGNGNGTSGEGYEWDNEGGHGGNGVRGGQAQELDDIVAACLMERAGGSSSKSGTKSSSGSNSSLNLKSGDNNNSSSSSSDLNKQTKEGQERPQQSQLIDAYVTKLVERHDLRGLLKQENILIGEIKTLDSEGKALVYNNYSKLTAASSILGSLQTEVEMKTTAESTKEIHEALQLVAKEAKEGKETEEENTTVSNATASIITSRTASESSSNDNDNSPISQDTPSTGENLPQHQLLQNDNPNSRKAAQWLTSNAIQTIQSLISAGNKTAASECVTKSIVLLDKWISEGHLDSSRLQTIKQEISKFSSNGILDVAVAEI